MKLTLLGVGAMNSPRFAPAGLLVQYGRDRVMLDGGPGAEPEGRVDGWLVTDVRAELIRELRALAWRHHLEPEVADFSRGASFHIEPRRVIHTSHPTFAYRIVAGSLVAVWAPEFFEFPEWASGADILFADASGYDHRIHFAGGVGGHASAMEVAEEAGRHDIKRLVFAHIGRPTIWAMDAGQRPPFGEYGHDGQVFTLREAAPSHARPSALGLAVRRATR